MKTILLSGNTGQVGWELQRALAPLGRVIAPGRAQMNLVDPDSIRRAIREAAPSIIVNAAGYTAVDKAESEPELVRQVNAVAPGIMGEEAKRANALLVHYSTDYVYDGKRAGHYVEADAPHPCNTYGRMKLEGERAIRATGCAHLTLRTSWTYSTRGTNFVLTMLRLARERQYLAIVDDQIGSPTWARALAATTTELIQAADRSGSIDDIFHVSASGYTSRLDFAREILAVAIDLSGIETGWAQLQPTTNANYPLPAKRPLNAATSKEKLKRVYGIEMPRWETLLRQFIGELMTDADWRLQAGLS